MSLLTNVLKFIKANKDMSHLVIAENFDEAALMKDYLASIGIKSDIASIGHVSTDQTSDQYVTLDSGLLQLEDGHIQVLIGMRMMMCQGYHIRHTAAVKDYAFSSTVPLDRRYFMQFIGRAGSPDRDVLGCIKIRPEPTIVFTEETEKKKKKSKAKFLHKVVEYMREHRTAIVKQQRVIVLDEARRKFASCFKPETVEYIDFDELCHVISCFADKRKK